MGYGPRASDKRTELDNLTQWAKARKITSDGIELTNDRAKGWSIIASRDIKEGESVLHIPADTIITLDSYLVRDHKGYIENCSVHGKLAAGLLFALVRARRGDSEEKPWMDILPSFEELKVVMPLLWPEKLQSYSPKDARVLLDKQRAKFQSDLNTVKKTGGFVDHLIDELRKYEDDPNVQSLEDEYYRAWLLVNTRSFYWDYPKPPPPSGRSGAENWKKEGKKTKREEVKKVDDCMALCAVIDCFNHAADEGCGVTFNHHGYDVTTLQDYGKGEELHVSYGSYGNDFLLVEYGFMLDDNKDDSISLDHIILPRCSEEQKDVLSGANMLGSYNLDSKDSCYRTECVLRLLLQTSPPMRNIDEEEIQKWKLYVDGIVDGSDDQKQVNSLLSEILNEYLDKVGWNIKDLGELEKMSESEKMIVATLVKRWEQIRKMVRINVERLSKLAVILP